MEEPLSLVFTGHMVDLPNRPSPRFPPELESLVREAIARHVSDRTVGRPKSTVRGYASLARGGDILFHEVCRSHGLRTTIVLPFSPEQFVKTSVEGLPSGNWTGRFQDLWKATVARSKRILDLPVTPESYRICNAEILSIARAEGRVHLIALWDRSGGDGPGGTADMIKRARLLGDEPTIINPKQL